MKSGTLLLLALCVGPAFSLKPIFFKVREVKKNSTEGRVHNRIFGGTQAYEEEFPFMIFAMMNVNGKFLSCSGSLIRPQWVLLAAHCVHYVELKPSDVVLAGGKASVYDYVYAKANSDFFAPINETEFGLQERWAEKLFVHPNYSEITLHYDVALVLLKKPFVMDFIQTIPLSLEKIQQRKTCTILGWGLTLGNQQNYELNVVKNKEVFTTEMGCRRKQSGPLICLAQDDSGICLGDSGSPLVCDGKVFGVASFIYLEVQDLENVGCENSEEAYYSELYPSLEWIKSVYSSGNAPDISWWNLVLCFWLYGKM